VLRDDRGFTLAELLVASVIAVLVFLGAGSFYLFTLRAMRDGNGQVFVQRQGTLIMEELGRQIRPATALNIVDATSPPGTCWDVVGAGSVGTVLMVSNTNVYCYYETTANALVRCQFDSLAITCSNQFLLSGGEVLMTANSWTVALVTPCAAAGGTCTAGVCDTPSNSCAVSPAVQVGFGLQDRNQNTLSFNVVFTTSRHL
jgi:prepilin-type N-terminal cleavage/methylation domain-containing protein